MIDTLVPIDWYNPQVNRYQQALEQKRHKSNRSKNGIAICKNAHLDWYRSGTTKSRASRLQKVNRLVWAIDKNPSIMCGAFVI